MGADQAKRREKWRTRWVLRKWEWYEFDGRTVLSIKVWYARFGVELRDGLYYAWLRPPRPECMPVSMLPRWRGGHQAFDTLDQAQLALFDYAWPEGGDPRFEPNADGGER